MSPQISFGMSLIVMDCVQHKIEKDMRSYNNWIIVIFSTSLGERQRR